MCPAVDLLFVSLTAFSINPLTRGLSGLNLMVFLINLLALLPNLQHMCLTSFEAFLAIASPITALFSSLVFSITLYIVFVYSFYLICIDCTVSVFVALLFSILFNTSYSPRLGTA